MRASFIRNRPHVLKIRIGTRIAKVRRERVHNAAILFLKLIERGQHLLLKAYALILVHFPR